MYRFGKNLSGQGECKFHRLNYNRYLGSIGSGMGKKMFEMKMVLL